MAPKHSGRALTQEEFFEIVGQKQEVDEEGRAVYPVVSRDWATTQFVNRLLQLKARIYIQNLGWGSLCYDDRGRIVASVTPFKRMLALAA